MTNLLTSQQANAANTCEERVASCEHVLSLADVAIKTQAATIESLVSQGERYRLAAEAAKPAIEYYETREAWYNNKLLWISIGAIAGAYVHLELSR